MSLLHCRDVARAGHPAVPGGPRTGHRLVLAPVPGRVVPLDEVGDPAFSQGMLGQGLGIEPTDGTVLSPVTGTVMADTRTSHALLIRDDAGVEVLVHVGIDTSRLGGRGFRSLVERGDRVRAGQPVIEFDPRAVAEQGLDPTVVVTVTNSGDLALVGPAPREGVVEAGAEVLRVVP